MFASKVTRKGTCVFRAAGSGLGGMLSILLLAGCTNTGADSAAVAANQKSFRDASVIQQAVQPAIATDPDLAEYVQLIGARLVEGARQSGAKPPGDVQFFPVICPSHNVIVPGGQQIYVTTGLITQCRSEEDLAAAMAHALAHFIDRHAQRKPPPDTTDPVV